MDNLAHTLVGAALGQAGLKKKTGLGMATLMIAANLPDIDAVTMLTERGSLALRRGWTHGPLALLVLPPLLAGAMFAFDRWQTRRGTRPPSRLPVMFYWLAVLAYIGILTHPLLDFLNTYGIRCLMPFSERWFYGDTLFIIDLWVWSILGFGIWLSRKREKMGASAAFRPALAALVVVAGYIGAMGVSGYIAEHLAAREAEARGLGIPQRVVASPVPINPFRREIVFDFGQAYGFGEFWWLPEWAVGPRLTIDPTLIPTHMDDPEVAAAARADQHAADFLYWSRLPFAEVERRTDGIQVTIGDARYNRTPSDGRFIVRVTLPP